MPGDPLNLIRLRPSKGETVIATVPSFFDGTVFVWSAVTCHRFSKAANCFRCGQRYEPNQLTASPAGNPFCQECWAKINPRIETARKCPVDGAAMKKRLVAEAVMIDVCTQCRGMWFDKGELEIIEKKSREMGWQQGFFSSILLM